MTRYIKLRALFPSRSVHINIDQITVIQEHDYEDNANLGTTVFTSDGGEFEVVECPEEVFDKLKKAEASR